jgi:hypothetical protein
MPQAATNKIELSNVAMPAPKAAKAKLAGKMPIVVAIKKFRIRIAVNPAR